MTSSYIAVAPRRTDMRTPIPYFVISDGVSRKPAKRSEINLNQSQEYLQNGGRAFLKVLLGLDLLGLIELARFGVRVLETPLLLMTGGFGARASAWGGGVCSCGRACCCCCRCCGRGGGRYAGINFAAKRDKYGSRRCCCGSCRSRRWHQGFLLNGMASSHHGQNHGVLRPYRVLPGVCASGDGDACCARVRACVRSSAG